MSSGQLSPIVVNLAISLIVIVPWQRICAAVELPKVALEPVWAPPALSVIAVAAVTAIRGPDAQIWVVAVVSPLLMWLAWADLRSKRIPTTGVYATGVCAIGVSAAAEIPSNGLLGWATTLLVGVVAAGVLLVCALLTGGRAIGAADVRIAFPIGILVGHWGFAALWLSFIVAVIVMFPAALFSLIRRRSETSSRRSATLPLAPALVVGAIVSVLLAP